MSEKNKAAQELGRLGKGRPKNFSEEELQKRAERMKILNQKRHDSKNLKVKSE